MSAVLPLCRAFKSTAYESDHLAVFHPRYIHDRVRAGDRAEVVLGHYFLPPPEIAGRKYQASLELPTSTAPPKYQASLELPTSTAPPL